MKDGYFASHELCSFLREKKVLEPLYVSQPVNGSTVGMLFLLLFSPHFHVSSVISISS